MSELKCVDNVQETFSADVPEWRRKCGCIRTSEKLKRILNRFPSPPPPTPLPSLITNSPTAPITADKEKRWSPNGNSSAVTGLREKLRPSTCYTCPTGKLLSYEIIEEQKLRSTFWHVITEVAQLLQLSVTATALALYYIIYCYMQLVYYTLRSALFFHNADVPMKITIGVVTMTSLVVGMNLLLRMERIVGLRI